MPTLPPSMKRCWAAECQAMLRKKNESPVLTNSIPLNKYLLSAFHELSNVLDTLEETKEVKTVTTLKEFAILLKASPGKQFAAE